MRIAAGCCKTGMMRSRTRVERERALHAGDPGFHRKISTGGGRRGESRGSKPGWCGVFLLSSIPQPSFGKTVRFVSPLLMRFFCTFPLFLPELLLRLRVYFLVCVFFRCRGARRFFLVASAPALRKILLS